MSARHRRTSRGRRGESATGARRLRTVGAVVVALVSSAVVCWLATAHLDASGGRSRTLDGASTDSPASAAVVRPGADLKHRHGPGENPWYAVLARLDATRERAWRQGSTALLAQVYAAGSPELKVDRRNLRAYLARGLHVEGVSLMITRLTVVEEHPQQVRLRVVDQLGPLEATTAGGRSRPLPDDRPTRHLIELRHEGGWRIARITVTAARV